MKETTIIGIDCATVDSRVGIAVGAVQNGKCVVQFAGLCSKSRAVIDEVSGWVASSSRTLVALDAPLGWPAPMGTALAAHRAGEVLDVAANDLFRRATDRFVKAQLKKQSLDVGADRIARTAHSALSLLQAVRTRTGLPIPMAWEASFGETAAAIEVYPAATLRAHDIPRFPYRKPSETTGRQAILECLSAAIQLPKEVEAMERYPDALDACVCVLAGFDFLQEQAMPPEDTTSASQEGWIWVRRPGTRRR